jgi:hypothetical protein
MKTAMEIADGFDRGRHRNRAQHLVTHAKTEAGLEIADEIEKLLYAYEQGGYGDLPVQSVLKSWINATREAAGKEE